MSDFEFYETPQAFTRYLFIEMHQIRPITGLIFEPCAGNGAIPAAYQTAAKVLNYPVDRWLTNDIDPRWTLTDQIGDALNANCWSAALTTLRRIDFTVTNPPFTPALGIIDQALKYSTVGVAMHLRASIHEVLKTGIRRTWMANNTPTGILWLPRFAYQRSKAKGIWSTDSVCACWVIWLKDLHAPQFIRYAPAWVLDELERETPIYRDRMDRLMGFHGTEADRQQQRIAA